MASLVKELRLLPASLLAETPPTTSPPTSTQRLRQQVELEGKRFIAMWVGGSTHRACRNKRSPVASDSPWAVDGSWTFPDENQSKANYRRVSVLPTRKPIELRRLSVA